MRAKYLCAWFNWCYQNFIGLRGSPVIPWIIVFFFFVVVYVKGTKAIGVLVHNIFMT